VTVSIVIPSWNGWQQLAANLPAVLAACERGGDAEVVVVDDGSEDGTCSRMAREYPAVRLVARPHNGGFAAAANDGVRAATGEFALCLNNDLRPQPEFLAPLVAALRADPELFAAAPRTWNARFGGDEAPTAARFRAGLIDVIFPDRDSSAPGATEESPILYACGGAAAYRRDRFLALGGFHSLFHPFYWEDADLGWRARRRGWGALHVPGSVVHHAGGATIGAHFAAAEVRATYERNRLLFIWSNLLDRALWRRHLAWLAPRLASAAVRGTPFALGAWRARARRAAALARRPAERAGARVGDREILRAGARPA
jgi:GT2 family glycosyltransferase